VHGWLAWVRVHIGLFLCCREQERAHHTTELRTLNPDLRLDNFNNLTSTLKLERRQHDTTQPKSLHTPWSVLNMALEPAREGRKSSS
jgi:hypothetical protein